MPLSDPWSSQSCGQQQQQQQQMSSPQPLISHSWDEKQGWTTLPLNSLSLLLHDLEADCCLDSEAECLESASQIWVASIAPAVTVLAPWAALEEPRGAASTQPCQGLCCLCSYCLPLEICLIGDPVGDFWPGSWQSFYFTKDHAIGPCRHPSVHKTCCLWVRMEIFQCWKSTIPQWLPFFSPALILWCRNKFSPPSQNCKQKFQKFKKEGAFLPSLFPHTV